MHEEVITLESLHQEIVNNRNHIKNYIEATEAKLILSIEEVKLSHRNLEKENQLLKEEVEYLKRKQNKNNIIVFGLKKKRENLTPDNICKDLKELIDVDLNETQINDIYPLGKAETCPIKIEFISHYTKKIVLQNCNKLRGKQISIAHDLTQQQREEQKILRKHLSLAKQETLNECYIRGNKLFVNGIAYKAEELQETSDNHTTQNSAPATPTVQQPKSSFETSDTPTNKKSVTKEKAQRIPQNLPLLHNNKHNKEETTSKFGKLTSHQNKPDATVPESKPRTRSITKLN